MGINSLDKIPKENRIKGVIIKPISNERCFEFTGKFHYSKRRPKLTKLCLGGFTEEELVCVMSLGWGVRPLHTIRKLFPSLGTKDYLEIGRMCSDEKMPRNTESTFIAGVIQWLKQNTDLKVLFTWSDGIMGKPGYVYQASNFLYGGFIWTDIYFTESGEKVHPRATNKIGGRPTFEYMNKNGWLHFRGKQFRYVYFMNRRLKRDLLKESTVKWVNKDMPKAKDIEYKVLTASGWENSTPPFYEKENASFRRFGEVKVNVLF